MPSNKLESSQSEAMVAPVDPGRRSILVVDGDSISRRFAEDALSKIEGAHVECVGNAASALDVLGAEIFDVVVTESTLLDMGGREFLGRLQRELRFSHLPVVVVSADGRVATRVGMLREGADDYLVKPFDPAELRVRVEKALRQHDAVRTRRRNYVLAGDFSGMPFADLINLLAMGRRTGRLSLFTLRASAQVLFHSGQVVQAVFGNLEGPRAFYALMAEEAGQFEFIPEDVRVPAGGQPYPPATAMMLEGARLLDTWRAQSGAPDPRATTCPVEDDADKTVELMPPALASGESVARYEKTVMDPFSLGELHLFDDEQLEQWTLSALGEERIHVILLADLAAGISAMMGVSSPLGSREVHLALQEKKKALGLAFRLRKERLLDVVLLDVTAPARMMAGLRRSPAVCILAPPDGDYFAIGVSARVELDRLLTRLAPPVLVAVGDEPLAQRISDFGTTSGHKIETRFLRGALGQGELDLRRCLIEGLRMSGEITDRFRAEIGRMVAPVSEVE